MVIFDSTYPFHLWKVCSYISSIALVYEVLITLVFWCLLYEKDDIDMTKALMHIVPIVLLAIDFCVNRITIEKRHLWPNLGILVVYGIINIIHTLVSGKPVYKMMPWDSFGAWIIGLVMLPFFSLLWWIMRGFQHRKFEWYEITHTTTVGQI
jgi:hypothetical protein